MSISSPQLSKVCQSLIKHPVEPEIQVDIKTEIQVEKEVPIPRSDPTDGDIIPQKSYPAYCTLCKVSAFPVTGHLNGNRHKENLKSQGKKAGNSSKFTISSKFVITDPTQNPNYIHCVLCEVFCGNQKTWDSHFNGKRHNQNQGNLLRGIEKKTVTREGISIFLLINVFFPVTNFLKGTKMV